MFSKTSRYRKLQDVITTDAKGQTVQSKSLRLLPSVSGTFLHTVGEGDRLDHLAYKYYKRSGKWWRICDANTELMSPCAMLGKNLVVTSRFPLVFIFTISEDQILNHQPPQPPWSYLLKDLDQVLGVEDVKVVEDSGSILEDQTPDGQKQKVIVYQGAVIVTYNKMNVSLAYLAGYINESLARRIATSEFEPGQPETVGIIGKKIIIPPDVVE